MTVNRRSKMSRARGTWTHGFGAKKKHRGAGHRGGRGNAGSGKEGDAKKPSYWAIKDYYGNHGFTSKSRNIVVPINVGYINTHVEELVAKGKITEKGGVYHIDCTKIGFDKLLSKGNVTNKFEIIVDRATEKAIEKITAAGGKVIVSDSAVVESATEE